MARETPRSPGGGIRDERGVPRQRWQDAASVAGDASGTRFRRAIFAETVDALAAQGYQLARTGTRDWPYRARCPGHDGDSVNALAVGERPDGTPRLKCHARDCDRQAILGALGLWFDPGEREGPASSQGYSRRPRHRSARPPATNAATSPEDQRPNPEQTGETASPDAARIAGAARIWDAAIRATGTPAHRYLAERFAWPRNGPALPSSVRWLPVDRAPPTDRAASWFGLPDGAAGAVVYRFDRRGGALGAVQCEALDADAGRLRPQRWRRTTGSMAGGFFEAAPGGGPLIVLAEGPVTALACGWQHPEARCLSTGGMEGLRSIDPAALDLPEAPRIVIEADGGRAGRMAAAAARDVLPSAHVIWRREGDTADDLADDLAERAAIVEFDGDTDRKTAEAAAWQPIISRRPDDER